jgi:hypothetical protein
MLEDDLKPLLAAPVVQPLSIDCQRAALLSATSERLQRRVLWQHRWRRLGTVGLIGAAFGIGWWAKPTQAPETVIVRHVVPATPSLPEATPPSETMPLALSIDQLEMQAEIAPTRAEAARLYRLAGDRFYHEARDYPEAARCYQLHLSNATPEQRAIDGSECWMLMSLKTRSTTTQEARHGS